MSFFWRCGVPRFYCDVIGLLYIECTSAYSLDVRLCLINYIFKLRYIRLKSCEDPKRIVFLRILNDDCVITTTKATPTAGIQMRSRNLICAQSEGPRINAKDRRAVIVTAERIQSGIIHRPRSSQDALEIPMQRTIRSGWIPT